MQLTTLQTLIPVIVPLAVALTKIVLPKLPKWTLPTIVAPLLGAAIEAVGTLSVDQDAITGALLGGLGVWLREVFDQVRKSIAEGKGTSCWAILVAPLMLLLASCATFEKTSYSTLDTVATTVSAARQSWVAYVTEQRTLIPDPANRQDLERKVAKVGAVYAQYQQAMAAAKTAIQSYRNSPADQTEATKALSAVSAASGDLVALIRSFLPTSTK